MVTAKPAACLRMLFPPACGRREVEEAPSTCFILPRVPSASPSPTRGWAFVASATYHHLMDATDFADTQLGMNHLDMSRLRTSLAYMVDEALIVSYVSIAEYEFAMAFGAETPGVAPTPQKRGPPPQLSGRGGRLPTWLAALRRPSYLGYSLLPISLCMNIDAELWILEELLGVLAKTWVAPTAR